MRIAELVGRQAGMDHLRLQGTPEAYNIPDSMVLCTQSPDPDVREDFYRGFDEVMENAGSVGASSNVPKAGNTGE